MFSDEQRKEFLEDGLTNEEIEVLESTLALTETIDMIPDDVEKFIKEYESKIPADTINGMKAIAYAAQNDPRFFSQLMALNMAMSYDDTQNQTHKQVKVLDELSDEEYLRAKHNYFKTLASLSDRDRKEFLSLIMNITPDQKADMIERLKNN
jgi:hypothetical protein